MADSPASAGDVPEDSLAKLLSGLKLARTLLIFDLNGVFTDRIYEPNRDVSSEGAVRLGNFLVWKRPGADDFLDFVFANFDVAVWSSVTRANAGPLVEHVFGSRPLKFVFDQSRCETVAAPPGAKKPLFLKNLTEVWKAHPDYDAQNTLLIDDSDEKSRNNPPGCHFNPGAWNRGQEDSGLLPGGSVRAFLAARLRSGAS